MASSKRSALASKQNPLRPHRLWSATDRFLSYRLACERLMCFGLVSRAAASISMSALGRRSRHAVLGRLCPFLTRSGHRSTSAYAATMPIAGSGRENFRTLSSDEGGQSAGTAAGLLARVHCAQEARAGRCQRAAAGAVRQSRCPLNPTRRAPAFPLVERQEPFDVDNDARPTAAAHLGTRSLTKSRKSSSAKGGSRIALSYNPNAISAHFNMRSLLRNASTAGSIDAGAPGPTRAVAATMSQR